MTTCFLCGSQVAKLKTGSHVIPRFAYRYVRGSSGKLVVLDLLNGKRDRKAQDGPKGDFLCEACEDRTQREDRYASLVLTNGSPNSGPAQQIKKTRNMTGRFPKVAVWTDWSGLDFKIFQSFILSLVLRDHCWRLSQGKPTIIDDQLFQKMRGIYFSPTLDDHQLPVIGFEATAVPGVDLSKSVTVPAVNQDGSGVGFTLVGYSFTVNFKLPTADLGMMLFIQTCKLKTSGTIRMRSVPYQELGVWERSAPTIEKIVRDDSR